MCADVQHLSNHERIRRELWAAVYRHAHHANLTASNGRIEPEFRWAEAADRALEQFDRRFGSTVPAGVAAISKTSDGAQQHE